MDKLNYILLIHITMFFIPKYTKIYHTLYMLVQIPFHITYVNFCKMETSNFK